MCVSATGDFVTDSIEAMGFMLLDARTNSWSPFLCELCGLDPEVLPEIVDPMQTLSPLTEEAMRDTGLTRATAGNSWCYGYCHEIYASGAIAEGQATVKLATAGRICSVTGREYVDQMLVTYRHVIPGLWYPGTATKTCAATNRWFRDILSQYEKEEAERRGIDAYILMSEAAAEVKPGADGLFSTPACRASLPLFRRQIARQLYRDYGLPYQRPTLTGQYWRAWGTR